MRRNDEIQSALISHLKGNAAIVNQLIIGGTDEKEIREDEWKGVVFKYPCVRVRLISNIPIDPQCEYSNITFSIMVFSEKQSSQEADRISGIIANEMNAKSFSCNGLNFFYCCYKSYICDCYWRKNMAKRSADAWDGELEDSLDSEYVKVMLMKNSLVYITGMVTGREYFFDGGGSIVEMDKRDAEELIENMKTTTSCCGTISTPKFMILKE